MLHLLKEGIQDIHRTVVDKQTLLEADILELIPVGDRFHLLVVGRLRPRVEDIFHPRVLGQDCSLPL